VQGEPLPESVRRLFWDVDPEAIDLERHRDYVMERVMSRGTWDAMCWLRARYSLQEIAEFLGRNAARLTPRDRAYWSLISGHSAAQEPGGGRPAWTG
jgi:hypothetical protein